MRGFGPEAHREEEGEGRWMRASEGLGRDAWRREEGKTEGEERCGSGLGLHGGLGRWA